MARVTRGCAVTRPASHWAADVNDRRVTERAAVSRDTSDRRAAEIRLRDTVTRRGPAFMESLASELRTVAALFKAVPLVVRVDGRSGVLVLASPENSHVSIAPSFEGEPAVLVRVRVSGHGEDRPLFFDVVGDELRLRLGGELLEAADCVAAIVAPWLERLPIRLPAA